MNHDDFKITLIKQYRAQIEEIIIESEHAYKSSIDYEHLDMKFTELFKSASVDGIEDYQIWEMISKRIPSYINYVNAKASSKKVA
jgi:hypothetical protein